MPAMTSYQPGQPIWVDLGTPDVPTTLAFYGSLFGWVADTSRSEEFGGYANFTRDGKKVAGVMPLMAPGMPPVWSCYFCTDDADKTTALVTESGGTVLAPPMDVAELGTMAVYLDPAGAAFGVWKPGTHLGSETVGEPGTPAWFELNSRDLDTALGFYADVLGLRAQSAPENAGYTELQLGGQTVAGSQPMPESLPAEVPSFWIPYFGSTDPRADAERAATLGATIMLPHMEFPGGEFSIVSDPHGSNFGLLRMNPS